MKLRQGQRESGHATDGVPIELGSHNPRIENVRALRSASGRREQGCFAIEGPTLVAEARRSGLRVRAVYAQRETLAAHPEIAALEDAATPVYTLPDRLFARLSELDTPSGILAIVDLPEADAAAILRRPGPVLLLAGVNDPGNAGTLVRSAEAFGAAGVLFGRGGVDPHAPKVVRAAMGALFRLPVASVDADRLLALAATAERTVIAADVAGEDAHSIVFPPSAILAIGNERRGVRDWLPRWDRCVRIPQRGPTESLNAAVAGSILLYLMAPKS